MPILVSVEAELGRFRGMVLSELHARMTPRLSALAAAALPLTRTAVRTATESSAEFHELISGTLRVEFGLSDGRAAVESVIRAIELSVQSHTIPGHGEYLGGVTLGAFRSDFSDALSADGARYTSVNAAGTSTPVEWLDWLLFAGDQVVIADYGIVGGVQTPRSRTGQHIMAKRKEGGRLAPWRVPPAFAGFPGHNWLSKAAEAAAPAVLQFLDREARKLLG